MEEAIDLLEAHLVGERDWIAIGELASVCHLEREVIVELAELGAVAHRGYAPDEWQLPATALPRLRTMGRLIRDLGVNASGAALAVELLEAQRELESRVRLLERMLGDH